MVNNLFITVFTPTYNRSHTLHRVFNSLCSQTTFNFEWLIVDDGSTDNTRDLVREFRSKDIDFEIKYFYQENKGKHIAINSGLTHAKGFFFLIADSDDYFDFNTLNVFTNIWSSLDDKSKDKCAGIWCNCKYENGGLVGTPFPYLGLYTYSDFKYRHKITGEKWHIERTDILKKFPFPNIKVGDNFYYGEGAIWRKIYKEYTFFGTNEMLRTYVHSEDGIMFNMDKNPFKVDTLIYGYLDLINEDIRYIFYSFKEFLFAFFLLVYYSKHRGYSLISLLHKVKPMECKVIISILWPFGFLTYILLRFKRLKFFRIDQ